MEIADATICILAGIVGAVYAVSLICTAVTTACGYRWDEIREKWEKIP